MSNINATHHRMAYTNIKCTYLHNLIGQQLAWYECKIDLHASNQCKWHTNARYESKYSMLDDFKSCSYSSSIGGNLNERSHIFEPQILERNHDPPRVPHNATHKSTQDDKPRQTNQTQRKTTNESEQHTKQPNAAQINARWQSTTHNTQSNETQHKSIQHINQRKTTNHKEERRQTTTNNAQSNQTQHKSMQHTNQRKMTSHNEQHTKQHNTIRWKSYNQRGRRHRR